MKMYSSQLMDGHKETKDQREATKTWEETCEDVTKRRQGEIPSARKQEPISEETRKAAKAYLKRQKLLKARKNYPKEKKEKEFARIFLNGQTAKTCKRHTYKR